MVDFASYPSVLASSRANAIKEPHTFLAVFIMNREGQGRLDFIQNVSFKFIELLSVMFARSPDDAIRQQIAFRYNSQKSRVAVMQARLHDMCVRRRRGGGRVGVEPCEVAGLTPSHACDVCLPPRRYPSLLASSPNPLQPPSQREYREG